jgi:hypothetical protein
MRAGRILIALLGGSVLLVSELERGFLQTPLVSWAGQAGLKSGDVIRDRLKKGGDGPEMVVIPAGRFRMGDIQGKGGPDEQPVREVHTPLVKQGNAVGIEAIAGDFPPFGSGGEGAHDFAAFGV